MKKKTNFLCEKFVRQEKDTFPTATEFAAEPEVLEGKFRNLNFSPSTKKTAEYSFELFLSIYRYLIFVLKFKTSTLSNNRFTGLVAQKHRAILRQEKITFSSPGRVALGLPSPFPRVCTDGLTYGRTLTSEPNFLASIGYHICFAMVLRWRTTRAGSAIVMLKIVSKEKPSMANH